MTQENKEMTWDELEEKFFSRKNNTEEGEELMEVMEEIAFPTEKFNTTIVEIDQFHKKLLQDRAGTLSTDHYEIPWIYLTAANGPKTREGLQRLGGMQDITTLLEGEEHYIQLVAPVISMEAWRDDRRQYMFELGKLLGENSICIYGLYLMAETWMLASNYADKFDTPAQQKEALDKWMAEHNGSIAQHPDRQSAMTASGLTIDGRGSMICTLFELENGTYDWKGMEMMLYGEKEFPGELRSPLLFSFMVGYAQAYIKASEQ